LMKCWSMKCWSMKCWSTKYMYMCRWNDCRKNTHVSMKFTSVDEVLVDEIYICRWSVGRRNLHLSMNCWSTNSRLKSWRCRPLCFATTKRWKWDLLTIIIFWSLLRFPDQIQINKRPTPSWAKSRDSHFFGNLRRRKIIARLAKKKLLECLFKIKSKLSCPGCPRGSNKSFVPMILTEIGSY
jgi:hypothetical protein